MSPLPFKLTPLSNGISGLVLCLALGQPLLVEAGVAAEGERRHWHLQQGDLSRSLTAFASQASIKISFDKVLTHGKSTSGLQGAYTVEQGLQKLLQGSGLVPIALSGGGYRLELAASGTAGSGLQIPPTSVTGQHPGEFDIYEQAGSVHKVTREQLDRVPYSRVGDIFDGVPGVAASGGANGAGLQVNIRGMQGHGRVKTLVDGTMQNASTYKGYPGNRDDTYIDPDLIAGIDIKKGPDAGPQGAGVVGGVVSMRTLNADDIIIDPARNWGVRLKGMYGNNVGSDDGIASQKGLFTRYSPFTGAIPSNNQSGSIAAAWQPLPNWSVTLAHARRESGNYRSGSRGGDSWKGLRSELADSTIYNSSLNSDTYLFKNKVTFLDDHSLEFGYTKYRNQSGFANAITGGIEDFKGQQRLAEAESHTYTLSYAWQPDNEWFDLRGNLWKNRLNSSGGVFTIGQDTELISDNLGAELWNTTRISSPLGDLSVRYGGSFAQEKASGDTVPASNLDAIVNAERLTMGSFVNAEYQPVDWLTFNAGLQHDRTELQDNKKSAAPEPDRTFTSTSPSYGIVLQPHEIVRIYAQWSQGERAPSLREAYIQAWGVMPNPILDTEKANNFEYGISFLFQDMLNQSDTLGIKFSRFSNEYKDYIVRLHRASMGERTENYLRYKFANIDKAKYEGYEVSVDYEAGWVFGRFALTYFDKLQYCYPGYRSVSGLDTGTPVACTDKPNVGDYGGSYVPPRQEKSATLGFRFFDQKLTLGARMKMSTASMYGGTHWSKYVDKTIWDNYEVYDLFGSYAATDNLEFGFSVENVTDRFYVPSYSDTNSALPAPGRTTRGTLTMRF